MLNFLTFQDSLLCCHKFWPTQLPWISARPPYTHHGHKHMTKSPFLLTIHSKLKNVLKFHLIFVTFSEYMNFASSKGWAESPHGWNRINWSAKNLGNPPGSGITADVMIWQYTADVYRVKWSKFRLSEKHTLFEKFFLTPLTK